MYVYIYICKHFHICTELNFNMYIYIHVCIYVYTHVLFHVLLTCIHSYLCKPLYANQRKFGYLHFEGTARFRWTTKLGVSRILA